MLRLLLALLLAIAFLFAFSASALAQFPPPPGTGPGLSETIEAIDSARVTTRILYITAHPDDESSAVLTYLARGLHADVALLSLTRGEGGQNALGPEQAPQLGLIRTQELLAATRGYGVKLYFTRAKDFGFSKTPEETEKIWGDQVLQDMVRVIRAFRPNIVINNFGGVHTGHGHHQTAGLWAPKAVALAADPSYQIGESTHDERETIAWGTPANPVQILNVDRFNEHPKGFILPIDEVSPLWGKTWRQIGMDAFASHRTQGITAFLTSPFFQRPIALIPEGGGPFDPKSLARSITAIPCSAFVEADKRIAASREQVLNSKWAEAASNLAAAADLVKHSAGSCPGEFGYENKLISERIDKALRLAAGVEIVAEADRSNLVAGENMNVREKARCRPEVSCVIQDANLIFQNESLPAETKGTAAEGLQLTAKVPALSDHLSLAKFIPDSPLVSVQQHVRIGNYEFAVWQPVTHIEATSTNVTRVPVRVVPAYTLSVDPPQKIEVLAAQHKPFDVFLRVHSYSTQSAAISAGLDVPQGWTVSAPVPLNFSGEGDHYAKLTVTPPAQLSAGHFTLKAFAAQGTQKFSTSLEPLPSLPTQLWKEPAQTVVHAFDIRVPENLRVGYISAESEPVPGALKNLGIRVDMLDPTAVNFGDLSHYDAIVIGVRAYELRSELPGANQRLLDYVQNGGTLVVQYQRDFAWDPHSYAPYPAKIGSKPGDPLPRTTDETAAVTFLKPDDPLLNSPNKITQDDFSGWVQERGLYYWSDFDSRYTPLLSMHDPGEKDLNGSLVYTRYGKGTYIYTGLAFFRQIPEGVPGSFRLLVNLLSASRPH